MTTHAHAVLRSVALTLLLTMSSSALPQTVLSGDRPPPAGALRVIVPGTTAAPAETATPSGPGPVEPVLTDPPAGLPVAGPGTDGSAAGSAATPGPLPGTGPGTGTGHVTGTGTGTGTGQGTGTGAGQVSGLGGGAGTGTGATEGGTTVAGQPGTGTTPTGDGSLLWSADFESGDLTGFRDAPWNQVGSPAPRIVAALGGTRALALTIPAGGARNEVVPDIPALREGDDLYFGFSTLLADGFPVDGGWQVLTQWKNHGTGSPPLSLAVENGRYHLDGGWGHPRSTRFHYQRDLGQAVAGQWHHWVVHIRFSASPAAGSVEVWQDGRQLLAPFSPPGGTLYPGLHSYLKTGYYRDRSIGTSGTLVLDNWRIGTGYVAVSLTAVPPLIGKPIVGAPAAPPPVAPATVPAPRTPAASPPTTPPAPPPPPPPSAPPPPTTPTTAPPTNAPPAATAAPPAEPAATAPGGAAADPDGGSDPGAGGPRPPTGG